MVYVFVNSDKSAMNELKVKTSENQLFFENLQELFNI